MVERENRWKASLEELRSPRTVAACGVLCALALILSLTTGINVGPYLKVGFSGLANRTADALYGPVVGMLFSGALEIIKFMMKPDGVWFPGFTVSAMLAGAMYGMAFYHRPVSLARVIAVQVAVKLLINLGLNTLWLSMLYHKAATIMLPVRLMANLVRLPADILLVYLLLKMLERVKARTKR